MKYIILLFLSSVLGFSSYSQEPNPELFRTWYLYSIMGSDLSDEEFVTDINPPIVPTLTIYDTLEFEGEGACNGFFGSYSSVDEMIVTLNDFGTTAVDCDNAAHDAFELAYFQFLQDVEYYSISFGDGDDELSLSFMNVLGGILTFQNFPLSIGEFDQPQISIYPNPVQSSISITMDTVTLYTIEIFDSQGKQVNTIDSNFSNIDLSNLATGIYFVKISWDANTIIEKIVKK